MEAKIIKGLPELVRLLDELSELHERLEVTIHEKLAAMRKADLHVMRDASGRQKAIMDRIGERVGLRRQLMDMIGAQIGLPKNTARVMTMSQLAARVGAAEGQRLKAAARRLADAMAPVAKANRSAGAMTARVIEHLDLVFASIRGDDEPAGYNRRGGARGARDAMLFEAVG